MTDIDKIESGPKETELKTTENEQEGELKATSGGRAVGQEYPTTYNMLKQERDQKQGIFDAEIISLEKIKAEIRESTKELEKAA